MKTMMYCNIVLLALLVSQGNITSTLILMACLIGWSISQFNLAVFSWHVLVIPHNSWRALPPERNCWSLKSCHWFQLSLKCHAYKCVRYLGIYVSGGKGKIWRKESVKENKKGYKMASDGSSQSICLTSCCFIVSCKFEHT